MLHQTISCWLRSKFNLVAVTLAGALLFLLAAVMAAQQTQVSTVVVSLQDAFGGESIPFAQAHVRVYPPPERAPAATGDAGTFSFGAKPGKYDLFVGATGFKTIAKRIEVQNAPAMALNLSLWIESCPPGPCFVIEAYNPEMVLSVSPDEDDRPLTLRVADLKSLKHQVIVVNNPDTQLQESYSGVSVADLLGLSELTGEYVFVSGDDGYVAFPRAKLATGLNGSKIVVADGLDGRSFSNRLRAFLIENGQVTQSVRGIIRIRLLSPR